MQKTMTELMEEALREILAHSSAPAMEREFNWVTVMGRVQPGIDIIDRDSLLDAMEGRR